MNSIIVAGLSFVSGVLLASQFGLPAAIGAGVGAAIGIALAALAGKNKLLGALFGAVIVSSAVLLFSTHNHHGLRCKYEDPDTLPPAQHPAGYVYVIQDVDISKLYKIGRTNNPSRRLKEFSRALPFQIEVVAVVHTEDAPTLEWQLQQRYAEQRQRGEWFKLQAVDIREICEI